MSVRYCTALSKRTRQRCHANAMTGRDVCYHHGGKTPAGGANHNFTQGRYSRFLPQRLAAKYAEAESDPQLISLHSELALLDARLADLLSRVDTGESGERWQAIQHTYATLQQARTHGDAEAAEHAMDTLATHLDAAISDYQAWAGIQTLIEQRRKLAETEQKRLVSTQQTINATEAMVLVAKLTDSATRALLGVSKRLSGEAAALAPEVDKLARQALSTMILELQQVVTYDGTPGYQLPAT